MFLLPGCLIVIVVALKLPTWWLFAYIQFLISLVLAEGGLYWHLKLGAIDVKSHRLPTYFHRLFKLFKVINWVFIVAYVPLFVWAWGSGWSRETEPFYASLMWLIALGECINYFHFQLMHDTRNDRQYLKRNRRLRPAPIATELKRLGLAAASD